MIMLFIILLKCKNKNVFKLGVTTNPDARIALSYGKYTIYS
jgi:hypothetical protein